MIYIGIDPGITGAIAAIDTESKEVQVYDIDHSYLDAVDAFRRFAEHPENCCAAIEKVGAMPKQGVSSTFKFGLTVGHLRGALLMGRIPILAEPTPQVWKKAVFGASISKLTRKDQKTAARDKARELYPAYAGLFGLVKHADRAEALLMAHYLMMMRGGRS
jgi:crossover junction endodeoxyribonuclease RuvC